RLRLGAQRPAQLAAPQMVEQPLQVIASPFMRWLGGRRLQRLGAVVQEHQQVDALPFGLQLLRHLEGDQAAKTASPEPIGAGRLTVPPSAPARGWPAAGAAPSSSRSGPSGASPAASGRPTQRSCPAPRSARSGAPFPRAG